MFKFEVNQQYANRNGRYTVLAIQGDKIHVRYDDGKEAHLKTTIQARIWNNMSIEQQASVSGKQSEQASSVHGSALAEGEQMIGYYIKILNAPSLDEFNLPGWADNVLMVTDPAQVAAINPDDRVLIYVLNAGNFVASVTISGDARLENPKVYLYPATAPAHFFPIEVDATAHNLMDGITCDSIGLDKLGDFNKHLDGGAIAPETLIKISEADFEGIAELLVELNDEDDEDDGDEYEPINDDDDSKDEDEEEEINL